MDEAESNPNSETSKLSVSESEKQTENKNLDLVDCQTGQKNTNVTNEPFAQPEAVDSADKKMEEDDGEDLPDNFFDDFSNNDFMAGLDIVDDWMDDEEDPERKRGDDYFQDDVELRAKSSEKKPDVKREHKREFSPRHRPRYNDRNHFMRRERYSRENEKFRRFRDRSFERRSRDREFNRRRSREREFDRKRSRSRDRFREERRSREHFKSRPREHEKRSPEVGNSKQDSKDRPLEEIDSRRDPEKTKRDIQRDKLRCAKDFEARVFQEQLKVAETGLVPPGTELDVVMEHEKRKQKEQSVTEKHPERKIEELPPRPVEKKRSSDRFRGREKTHSKSHGRQSRERHSRERRSRDLRSRERHSRERELRNRRYSPDLRSRKREYGRFNRSRDRSLSPRFHRRSRSINREEMYRRNDDLRLRIREKRRERFFNELSPVSEAKFSRSPSLTNLSLISNISEREFWLRNRDKYKSRYGRSCSPISSSSLSDLGSPRRKRSRKASFMEEIERKLRERAHTNSTTQYGSPLLINPEPPKPVPPPQQFQQQMPMNLGYQPQTSQIFSQGMVPNPFPQPQVVDQRMMHHQPMSGMPVMNMMNLPGPMGVMGGPEIMGQGRGMLEQPVMQMNQVVNQVPMQVQQALNSPLKVDSSLHRTASNLKPCVSEDNKEVTKLFEEQKISLSDYLSVSAKPIDKQLPTINVHKKIKVISKCQDVIRVLKEDSKFCGRFFPKPAPPGLEKPEEKSMKWKSPLRKTFPVRFMFTTPCRKPPNQQDLVKNIINKLLFVCGIPPLPDTPTVRSAGAKTAKASIGVKPGPNIPKSPANSMQKPAPAPNLFSAQKTQNNFVPQQSVIIKRTSVGSQTEPVICQICEIRSARKCSDQGCQTIEKELTDETTQVTNEDLQKSMVTFTPRGILKNSSSSVQSLSHLTPAQLLALQQEKSDDGWNISSRNETFVSRNMQDQFGNSSGNFMGRNTNTSSSTSFNSNLNSGINQNMNMGRLNSNMPSGNFNSSFSGSMEKLSYSSMQNRPFSGPQSIQHSSMNPGNSMNDFQNMGSRNADNRQGNFDRFPNDRYSPEKNFNDPNNMNFSRNMGGNMGANMSNRGRGGASNQGFFMGFGGQNRPFYNKN